jgi:hypothetical protein
VIRTRVIRANADGEGTVSCPPARLVAVEGTVTNRTHTYADTDYLEDEEPFINGPLVASGTPDSVIATCWIRYPGS